MNFAVIGVGRIGFYHIRDFLKCGYSLKGIINTSKKSSMEKAIIIKDKYNIDTAIYSSIEELIKNENIDVIIISSSINSHVTYINKCIEFNINFLCEKPFIYESSHNNFEICKKIINSCIKKDIYFNVQTQWVYGIDQIKKFFDENINKISLYMGFYNESTDIYYYIKEFIPHFNSIIIFLLGYQNISNISFNLNSFPKIIKFNYGKVLIEYKLGNPEKKDVIFTINEKKFKRIVDENYNQSFINDNKVLKINDPFFLSIKNFINRTPLITYKDILKNIEIMDILSNQLINKN